MNAYSTLWTSIYFSVPQDTKAAKSAARKFINAVRLQCGGTSRFVISKGRGAGLVCCSLEKAQAILKPLLPEDGELMLTGVTDKQYEKSAMLWGKMRKLVTA